MERGRTAGMDEAVRRCEAGGLARLVVVSIAALLLACSPTEPDTCTLIVQNRHRSDDVTRVLIDGQLRFEGALHPGETERIGMNCGCRRVRVETLLGAAERDDVCTETTCTARVE